MANIFGVVRINFYVDPEPKTPADIDKWSDRIDKIRDRVELAVKSNLMKGLAFEIKDD